MLFGEEHKQYIDPAVEYFQSYYPEHCADTSVLYPGMADVLQLQYRFRNEPDFAELLLSTGNSQILYVVWDDVYWGHREGGENWMGRLLELVHSDLVNDRSE